MNSASNKIPYKSRETALFVHIGELQGDVKTFISQYYGEMCFRLPTQNPRNHAFIVSSLS